MVLEKGHGEIQDLDIVFQFTNFHVILEVKVDLCVLLGVKTCVNIWVLNAKEILVHQILIPELRHHETESIEGEVTKGIVFEEGFGVLKVLQGEFEQSYDLLYVFVELLSFLLYFLVYLQ
jgi:hypothetical protein